MTTSNAMRRSPRASALRAVLACATAALVAAACGGSTPTTGPGGTGPAATTGPGNTAGPAATPAPPSGAEGTATLTLDGADVQGSWELKGGKSVKPTDTLVAAIFTETVDDVAAGHGDLITISLGGTAEAGTRPTSSAGVTLSFSFSRIDASGNDLFSHTFLSSDGSCQVTMATTATGWSGSFTCANLKDADGHAASANGTFNT